uniref:Uncharacterized protein n=1 Tax=Bosea sp. NBC_00436 TaxID=2969620 RepID=A0A9E7ZY35_9HYPH
MSIADEILAFATGPTHGCTAGRSMARLYLALQGWPVPICDTTTGLDDTRLRWWGQAMTEYGRGQWRGSHDDAESVARRHPEIYAQAQAARAAIDAAERRRASA